MFHAGRGIAFVPFHQNRGIRSATLTFHPLRQPLLNPGRRVALRFLLNEAVSQFMLKHPRQLQGHFAESLNRHAQPAVIQCAHPFWRAGDVGKRFLGVKDHADLLGWRITEFAINCRKMFF